MNSTDLNFVSINQDIDWWEHGTDIIKYKNKSK